MKIRKINLADLDVITNLYIDFLNYQLRFGKFVYKHKPKINKKELKQTLKKRIIYSKDKLFLVAEEKNGLVGFVQAEIISNKKGKTNKKVVEIVDIYSKFKRKGIGKKLLLEIEKWANSKKTDFILWEFISGNKSAEDFCIKNKFKYFKIKMLKKLKNEN